MNKKIVIVAAVLLASVGAFIYFKKSKQGALLTNAKADVKKAEIALAAANDMVVKAPSAEAEEMVVNAKKELAEASTRLTSMVANIPADIATQQPAPVSGMALIKFGNGPTGSSLANMPGEQPVGFAETTIGDQPVFDNGGVIAEPDPVVGKPAIIVNEAVS